MFKKQNLTPEKTKAVSYFNQFPANFLKPYGRAADPPTEETINKRTNPISCEWFLCPKVVMSEFAATMVENLALLEDHNSPLVKNAKFRRVMESSQAFVDALNSLNSNSSDNATDEDVKTVLQYMYDEDNGLEAVVDDMFTLGGAMFTTAIHYMVSRSLFSDPKHYSTKLETDNHATKQFKSKPNIQGLKAFLTNECVTSADQPSTSSACTKSRKRLLEELEKPETPAKKKKTKHTKNTTKLKMNCKLFSQHDTV